MRCVVHGTNKRQHVGTTRIKIDENEVRVVARDGIRSELFDADITYDADRRLEFKNPPQACTSNMVIPDNEDFNWVHFGRRNYVLIYGLFELIRSSCWRPIR